MCKMPKALLDLDSSPLGPVSRFIAKTAIWLQPNLLHPCPYEMILQIAEGKFMLFHGAPMVILLLIDKRCVGKPLVDIGACGENMILAAHSHGLGSCWVGFVEPFKRTPKWRRRLDIERPYDLCEGIALGYPVGNPDGMVPRQIHEIKWFENGTMKVMT